VASLSRGFSSDRRRLAVPLALLMGVVGIVLLIACANVANLLLARAAARAREIAVRVAIGAGAGRLLRQLTAEALLLSAIGTAAGLVLAIWGTRLLSTFVGSGASPIAIAVGPNPRILTFAAGLGALSALVFGLGPIATALRVRVSSTMTNVETGRRRGRV